VARNPGQLWNDAALGLIMGGTLGNGFDRIVHGTVTDFVNVHFWPVFNVADSAISIGVVALVAGYVLRRPTA
jgi:signal peptidase II